MFVPDLSTMVMNLGIAIPELMRLVTAIGYVLGMFFVIKGIVDLKNAMNRTQQGETVGVKNQLILIGIGSALIYLPSTVNVAAHTFWSNPVPYAYLVEEIEPFYKLLKTILSIVYLIGTVAFIRGLVIWAGHSQGKVGRGLAFVIGGIGCIFIESVLLTVYATLGYGTF